VIGTDEPLGLAWSLRQRTLRASEFLCIPGLRIPVAAGVPSSLPEMDEDAFPALHRGWFTRNRASRDGASNGIASRAMKPIVVIGAGMGGLTAALRLARRNLEVLVLEARPGAGGLVPHLKRGLPLWTPGRTFCWTVRPGMGRSRSRSGTRAMGFNCGASRTSIRLLAAMRCPFSCQRRGNGCRFGSRLAGKPAHTTSGNVESMGKNLPRLQPMLERQHPRARRPDSATAPGICPFSVAIARRRSVGRPAAGSSQRGYRDLDPRLPGQPVKDAPSPMAFVSSLIHHPGCFYPSMESAPSRKR